MSIGTNRVYLTCSIEFDVAFDFNLEFDARAIQYSLQETALLLRSSMVSSMESMTWACSLRETPTPVPCQATQHRRLYSIAVRRSSIPKQKHQYQTLPSYSTSKWSMPNTLFANAHAVHEGE